MNLFEVVAKSYGIADREFTVRLTGPEALCIISLIQLGHATTAPGQFERVFPRAVEIAKGIIETVREVDPGAADQLAAGWGIQHK